MSRVFWRTDAFWKFVSVFCKFNDLKEIRGELSFHEFKPASFFMKLKDPLSCKYLLFVSWYSVLTLSARHTSAGKLWGLQAAFSMVGVSPAFVVTTPLVVFVWIRYNFDLEGSDRE